MFYGYRKLREYYKKHKSYDMPYAPSSHSRIDNFLTLSQVRKGEKTLDLGAGDGRIVISFGKAGARAYGVEIDSILCKLAEYNIRKNGLEKTAHIIHEDFWKVNLSTYDIISIYGLSLVMAKLERKVKSECKSGCRVVCNYFPFPTLKPEKEKECVFLYRKR